MLTPELLHFISLALAIGLSAIGNGIGQGIASAGALNAIDRQDITMNPISRAMTLGLALIETGSILALTITLFTLFSPVQVYTWPSSLAELGMGLAIGLSAAAVSIASSLTVRAACQSVARQPFFGQKILTLMLLAQSIIEAPVIFAFIVALLIKGHITPDLPIATGIKLLAAGLAIGIGSIGPSTGQAILASSTCAAAGLNTAAFNKIFTFSLLSQAVIETPVIFCLLIAMSLIYKATLVTSPLLASVNYITPALTVSIGSLGPAIANGFTASRMSQHVAMQPDHYPLFVRTSLLAQAVIESSAIYALLVALFLLTSTF